MRLCLAVLMAVSLATAGLFISAEPLSAQGSKAFEPFNGKDLTGWKLKGKAEKSKWTVGIATLDPSNASKLVVAPFSPAAKGPAELINAERGGVDIYTEQKFRDCIIDIEVMVPKGSNSGIYVMGEYEVQVLDSYGREKVGAGDLGGLYNASAPKVNAAKKPGEWQRFVMDFQAPRFEGGKRVENAKFIKITLNDQVIHENVPMKGPTPSGVTGKESPEGGPIMFQGDHGAVAYRNIKITPK